MGLFRKGTKPYSIFNFKCPRCNEGDLYYTPTFSFKRPFDMKDHCEHCQQPYLPEPGFYYGSMFLSYIFVGWFCMGFIILLHWVWDWSLELSFGLLILFLGILYIWIFRCSRSLWLSLNVKYDPDAITKGKKQKVQS